MSLSYETAQNRRYKQAKKQLMYFATWYFFIASSWVVLGGFFFSIVIDLLPYCAYNSLKTLAHFYASFKD